ncbi:hypothetical protein DXG03_008658 [Asterophora parasitica]|uniref:Uncharacterized protein n=1 Tax=Asterophora parasitica TaxID=117018 RepID=A0A9P7G6Y9_9AGAR|nr:hypothetical protein DXG03_008658 [Asterophora parasitica]
MTLRRVGGRSDGGIDLLGWWWLPPLNAPDTNASRRRLRVLAQCKAEKKKMSPKYVREMEGVLHRYLSLSPSISFHAPPNTLGLQPSSTQFRPSQYPLVALLISESPFSKSTILRAQSSPVPLFLLHIPPTPAQFDISMPTEEAHDCIGTAVWNPALAGARGLLRGEMEARWERSLDGAGSPGLWWRNVKLKSWTPERGSAEADAQDLDLKQEDLFLESLARDAA